MNFWLGFLCGGLVGLAVGTFVGIVVLALCSANKRGEKE